MAGVLSSGDEDLGDDDGDGDGDGDHGDGIHEDHTQSTDADPDTQPLEDESPTDAGNLMEVEPAPAPPSPESPQNANLPRQPPTPGTADTAEASRRRRLKELAAQRMQVKPGHQAACWYAAAAFQQPLADWRMYAVENPTMVKRFVDGFMRAYLPPSDSANPSSRHASAEQRAFVRDRLLSLVGYGDKTGVEDFAALEDIIAEQVRWQRDHRIDLAWQRERDAHIEPYGESFCFVVIPGEWADTLRRAGVIAPEPNPVHCRCCRGVWMTEFPAQTVWRRFNCTCEKNWVCDGSQYDGPDEPSPCESCSLCPAGCGEATFQTYTVKGLCMS